MTDYEIQEDFLNKIAEMYTSFTADPIADMLMEDFHYSSMWVLDEIKSRDAYLYYITKKLEAMKKSGVKFNFVMMYKQGDGQPVLMFSPKTPDGGYGAFIAETDKSGKIKRMDLMAAGLYSLGYKDKAAFEEFEKKAL